MSPKQKLHLYHRFPWHGAVGVLVLVSAVAVVSTWQPKTMDQAVVADSSKSSERPTITITTADGIKLQAETTWPVRNVTVPAVILIHQFGADHHQWDTYVSTFTEAGIGVVAYDIRGFGKSTIPEVAGNREEYLRSMNQDVPAVVAYLKSQPYVDASKISVVGASLGANLAYVAAGSDVGIYRTVMLSPGDYQTILQPNGVAAVQPQNVLGMADEKEQLLLKKIMAQVKEPKKSATIAGGGHGVELLAKPSVVENIIDWVK